MSYSNEQQFCYYQLIFEMIQYSIIAFLRLNMILRDQIVLYLYDHSSGGTRSFAYITSF